MDNNYDVKLNDIQCNEEDPAKYFAMFNVKKFDMASMLLAI